MPQDSGSDCSLALRRRHGRSNWASRWGCRQRPEPQPHAKCPSGKERLARRSQEIRAREEYPEKTREAAKAIVNRAADGPCLRHILFLLVAQCRKDEVDLLLDPGRLRVREGS